MTKHLFIVVSTLFLSFTSNLAMKKRIALPQYSYMNGKEEVDQVKDFVSYKIPALYCVSTGWKNKSKFWSVSKLFHNWENKKNHGKRTLAAFPKTAGYQITEYDNQAIKSGGCDENGLTGYNKEQEVKLMQKILNDKDIQTTVYLIEKPLCGIPFFQRIEHGKRMIVRPGIAEEETFRNNLNTCKNKGAYSDVVIVADTY